MLLLVYWYTCWLAGSGKNGSMMLFAASYDCVKVMAVSERPGSGRTAAQSHAAIMTSAVTGKPDWGPHAQQDCSLQQQLLPAHKDQPQTQHCRRL